MALPPNWVIRHDAKQPHMQKRCSAFADGMEKVQRGLSLSVSAGRGGANALLLEVLIPGQIVTEVEGTDGGQGVRDALSLRSGV